METGPKLRRKFTRAEILALLSCIPFVVYLVVTYPDPLGPIERPLDRLAGWFGYLIGYYFYISFPAIALIVIVLWVIAKRVERRRLKATR